MTERRSSSRSPARRARRTRCACSSRSSRRSDRFSSSCRRTGFGCCDTEMRHRFGRRAARRASARAAWDRCVTTFDDADRGAAPASGSALNAGMVICPCSMGTLSAIAVGPSRSLVERAADVALKERRKLILVPRETPLSAIHLENMLRVTRAGAVVMPAAPGFYHRPAAIDDLVNFVVARVLDHLDVPHTLVAALGRQRRGRMTRAGRRTSIGLISDTHGLVRPDVHTALAGVELILHAGDVGGDDMLDELALIAPVRAVRGNTDPPGRSAAARGDRARDRRRAHPREPRSRGRQSHAGKAARAIRRRRDRLRPHAQAAGRRTPSDRWVVNPGAAGARRFDLLPSVAQADDRWRQPSRSRSLDLRSRASARRATSPF